MLCSFENVGSARVTVRPASRSSASTPPAPVQLDMRWEKRSSQQCLADIGTSGPGRHVVTVEVTSAQEGTNRNQVKVMGIYEQRLQRKEAGAATSEDDELVVGRLSSVGADGI